MPLPAFAIPIIAQLGATALGAGANALFNKRPEVPDLSGQVGEQFDRARTRLDLGLARQLALIEQALGRRGNALREQLAAMGATGSGGVAAQQSLYDANNAALSSANAGAADAIMRLEEERAGAVAGAEQEEALMRFGQRDDAYRNRAQAIGDLVGSVGPLVQDFLAKKYAGTPVGGDLRTQLDFAAPAVTGQRLSAPRPVGAVAPDRSALPRTTLDPALLRALANLS